ncbi:MAG TPA: hypothetical protein VN540_06590 [Clostridia bacterium]|nr:hypothetical protein [Clostridia bacterium]
MKKLFALVMVLAMALAIAVPAMAAGWDQIPVDPPTTNEITLSLTPLKVEANTSVLGSLYEELSVMYPVVKGTLVHFYAEINIPADAKLSQANKDLLQNKNLVYALETSNLVLKSVQRYLNGAKDGAVVTFPADTDSYSEAFDETDKGTKIGFEYLAEGVAAGKDGVAVATIGYYNTWDGTTFGWDNDADGINEYMVAVDVYAAPTSFTIYKGAAAPGPDSIMFPVKNGQIDVAKEIELTVGGTAYAVTRAVNGDITFRNKTTSAVITPADTTNYPTLKAAFDAYFTALGFGYADAKYMTPAHFDKYFGTIAEVSKTITYPSGAVVVAPPTVEPPQTGDATTVVGFVMIALALVAAAAVTVKKVRA